MRDFYSNVAVAQALAPAVQEATINGAAVNVAKASGAVIVVETGAAVGAGAFAAKLQESADGATEWADVPAARVKSNAPAVLAENAAYRMGYLGKLPFVRVVLTKASGTSLAVGALAVLRPTERPVA